MDTHLLYFADKRFCLPDPDHLRFLRIKCLIIAEQMRLQKCQLRVMQIPVDRLLCQINILSYRNIFLPGKP